MSWPNLPAGTTCEWFATASDGALLTSGPTNRFTVVAGANTPPTVAITSPADNDNVTASFTITSAATADPDHDGIPNAVEFVLGTEPNPARPNANFRNSLPSLSRTAESWIVSFPRAISSKSATTALAFEVGTTLDAWPDVYQVGFDSATSDPGVSVGPAAAGYESVSLILPAASDACRFARLRVTIAP